jgi:hypothetical protein
MELPSFASQRTTCAGFAVSQLREAAAHPQSWLPTKADVKSIGHRVCFTEGVARLLGPRERRRSLRIKSPLLIALSSCVDRSKSLTMPLADADLFDIL